MVVGIFEANLLFATCFLKKSGKKVYALLGKVTSKVCTLIIKLHEPVTSLPNSPFAVCKVLGQMIP
jgi:hypothetical protein